jgi:hypothetical protein
MQGCRSSRSHRRRQRSGITVGGRWQWENLLDVLQRLAVSGRMDFRIERTTGAALVFTAEVIGLDRTETANWPGAPYYVFAPTRATLPHRVSPATGARP